MFPTFIFHPNDGVPCSRYSEVVYPYSLRTNFGLYCFTKTNNTLITCLLNVKKVPVELQDIIRAEIVNS